MKHVPLLLIHGYPFDHSMWFSSIAALGANARVLAPDLPGFGKAPIPQGKEPSLEAMADHLIQVLDSHQEEKVVVAGMSMGGYVALALIQKYPKRFCGLGLVSSQAAADTPETRQARKDTIVKIQASGPGAALETLLPKLFSEGKAEDATLRQYAINGAEQAGIEGLCWALEAMAGRPDRTALFRSLRIPVLVLHGSADKIIPVAKAQELAAIGRDSIMIELNGVGHASPLESPDQVADGLAQLLEVSRGKESN